MLMSVQLKIKKYSETHIITPSLFPFLSLPPFSFSLSSVSLCNTNDDEIKSAFHRAAIMHHHAGSKLVSPATCEACNGAVFKVVVVSPPSSESCGPSRRPPPQVTREATGCHRPPLPPSSSASPPPEWPPTKPRSHKDSSAGASLSPRRGRGLLGVGTAQPPRSVPSGRIWQGGCRRRGSAEERWRLAGVAARVEVMAVAEVTAKSAPRSGGEVAGSGGCCWRRTDLAG